MLIYSPNWLAGSSAQDLNVDSYSESSFTLTPAKGQTMSFTFFGTAVSVFGAKRPGHGSYQAMMDNIPSETFNGAASTPQFKQMLFNATLAKAAHNLTVVNGDGVFDVDYVTFNTSIGKDDEDLIVNTFQDSHPSFSYTPTSLWTMPLSVGTFSGGSGQCVISSPNSTDFLLIETRVQCDKFAICFSSVFLPRDAVAFYGPVGPDSTPSYSVQIDDRSPSFFSAQKQFYRSQQILFYSAGLGGGQHSIKVGLGAPGQLAIDYANVYTTPSLGGRFSSVTPFGPMPMGGVAALAITATLAILATLLSMYLLWRQRHELFHYSPTEPISSNSKVVLPFILSPNVERSLGRRTSSSSSQASIRYRTSMYSVARSSTMMLDTSSMIAEGPNSGARPLTMQEQNLLPQLPGESRPAPRDRDTKSGFPYPLHLDLPQSGSSSQYVGLPGPLTAGGQPPPEYTASPNSDVPPIPSRPQ